MSSTDSRVKKSLLNARVNLIFYFLVLILSFFSRKIFLDTLGAEFIGFTSTLRNLLSYLNLAELGIATAIGYVLYKPLYEHNTNKINEIISVFGYLYSFVGKVILVCGVILALFLPIIFPKTTFDLLLIYFAYVSFLASSLIGYFLNYKQTLLGADQRNYEVIAYYQGSNIIKTIVQLVSAYYTHNYYLWVSIELTFGIIYSYILNYRIAKVYPWLNSEIKQGRLLFKKYPEIIKYTKQLFVQKISLTVQYWTIPFLTYAFASLQIVAYYENYTIITDKVSQFVSSFLGSTSAGVGNLIAEGNKKKILSVFYELLSIRYYVGAVVGFSVFTLIEPFISIWLGEKYLLSDTVLFLIIINLFISYTRGGVIQFIEGYGLFYDVWAAIVEIIINLGIAISLGYYYGLPGVLMGGITSQFIIAYLWKPYFLFSKGFQISVFSYWLVILKLLCLLGIPAVAIYYIGQSFTKVAIDGYFQWLVYAICYFISYSTISFILLYIFSLGFRNFVLRFASRVKIHI